MYFIDVPPSPDLAGTETRSVNTGIDLATRAQYMIQSLPLPVLSRPFICKSNEGRADRHFTRIFLSSKTETRRVTGGANYASERKCSRRCSVSLRLGPDCC